MRLRCAWRSCDRSLVGPTYIFGDRLADPKTHLAGHRGMTWTFLHPQR